MKRVGSTKPWRLILAIGVLVVLCRQRTLGQQAAKSSPPAQQGGSSPGGSADLATQANDPTAALVELQFQNSYTPAYYGTEGEGNTFILQPVLPSKRHGWFPPTITRPTIPLVIAPNGRTGLGDSLFISVGLYAPLPKLKLGAGPVFIVPSSTNRFAGSGKWQLGPSAVAIFTGIKGTVIGALVENPISFAGESSRPDKNAMSVQPIIVKTLPKASYVRFDPTMSFDWKQSGAGTVPVNMGVGRLFKLGTQAINAYLQPEWTVHRPNYPGAVSRSSR